MGVGSIAEHGKAQVEKKAYKNLTAGHLGVVKLDHLGAQIGHNVEPHAIVYLSDDEATLTARAPRDPADNPFVEKTFQFYDETGAVVERPMCSLALVEDDRDVPSERFVPTQAQVTATHEALSRPGAINGTNVPIPNTQPDDTGRDGSPTKDIPQVPAPTSVASQHGSPVPSESAGTGEANGGAIEQAREGVSLPPDGQERTVTLEGPDGPQEVTSSVKVLPPEEHAGVTEKGEETGAAQMPVGEAPEGEFASHEEVGSPDAPRASKEDDAA